MSRARARSRAHMNTAIVRERVEGGGKQRVLQRPVVHVCLFGFTWLAARRTPGDAFLSRRHAGVLLDVQRINFEKVSRGCLALHQLSFPIFLVTSFTCAILDTMGVDTEVPLFLFGFFLHGLQVHPIPVQGAVAVVHEVWISACNDRICTTSYPRRWTHRKG